MPKQITKNQAADLYLSELQSQMSKVSKVDRNIKRFIVRDPMTKLWIRLSYVDMITEVQNRTTIGMDMAIEYVQQLKVNGEPQYQIVG